MNSIGERIKMKRIEKGWSQRDLAAKMNYSNHSTIGKIEAGKVDIPQSRVVQFAEVLNTTVAYIMGWEEQIESDPVGAAELHFEMIMDEDLAEIFEDFKKLDATKKKIVKDLVRSLANTEA